MKLRILRSGEDMGLGAAAARWLVGNRRHGRLAICATSAFTLIEIAICLGIVAFALVAIIGILPAGLQVQRDNREDTIINQEGTYLMEAIRNGAEGLEDLAQRIDYLKFYSLSNGQQVGNTISNITALEAVGYLSTPSELNATEVRAVITAAAGSVAETSTELAFQYEVRIRNYPFVTSNPQYLPKLRQAMSERLRDVRLEFRWPVLRNGVGAGRQIFRGSISGILTNDVANRELFFVRQFTRP